MNAGVPKLTAKYLVQTSAELLQGWPSQAAQVWLFRAKPPGWVEYGGQSGVRMGLAWRVLSAIVRSWDLVLKAVSDSTFSVRKSPK